MDVNGFESFALKFCIVLYGWKIPFYHKELMMPTADRFTAEQLIGVSDQRRPSAFARYINLIRQVHKDDERKSSDENSPEKRRASLNFIRAASLAVARRSTLHDSRLTIDDYNDKDGRGSWKKATISSGDYNGDFVSTGREDTTVVMISDHDDYRRLECHNGNSLQLPLDNSLALRSPWKKLMLAKGCVCTNGNLSASPSPECQTVDDKIIGENRLSVSPDAEPLAPFLLGMLITSAPSMRQQGMESAIKSFEEDVWV